MNIKLLSAYALLAYFLLLLFGLSCPVLQSLFNNRTAPAKLPDFSQYEQVQDKKDAFFSFLRPVIQQANNEILVERRTFLDIKARYETVRQGRGKISARDRRRLAMFAKKYKVKKSEPIENQLQILNLRINKVPQSLVLTQAANESAWGTSRFALDANNLFGQWCFTKGCGIVPANRAAGAKHEVKYFDSIQAAVASYLRNINTHRAYRGLRRLRLELENKGESASGYQLAGELGSYSERGADYIQEVRHMIRSNNLE